MGKVKFDKLLGRPVLHVHDPLYMRDPDGVEWMGTIDASGVLSFTQVSNNAGLIIGLPFGLTYSS